MLPPCSSMSRGMNMPPAKKGVYGPRGDRASEYTPEKAAYMKAWRERNREKVREYNRKSYDKRRFFWKRSRVTQEKYGEMLAEQNGLCGICNEPETYLVRGKLRPLAVDHNHKTGQVRSLLCMACNTGLGKFRDSPSLLLSACGYLSRHELEAAK